MLFRTKRSLREEIVHLEYRIKDLENRLCPAEEHDWKLIGSDYTMISPYDSQTVNNYLCRRCGKRKREYEP